MNARTLGVGLAAGLATFIAVGAAVTELAAPAIEFSLFVGLPVGGVAGLTAFALVSLGLADDAPRGRRRVATGAGAFGVVFLLVFAVEAVVLSTRPSIALSVATIVGAGLGVVAFLRAA